MSKELTPCLQFEHWLNAAPSDVLFICRGRSITRAETARAALELAAKLRDIKSSHALSDGTQTAIMTDSVYAFIVSLCACSLADLNPVLPGHKRVNLLKEQAPELALILTDSLEITKDAESSALYSLYLSPEPEDAEQDLLKSFENKDSLRLNPDLKLTLFTSGSTGLPKAVAKPVALMQEESRLLRQVLSDKIEHAVLACTVYPYHMYGLTFSVFLPMSCRIPVHIPMQHFTEELCALPYEEILLISSPAFMQRLDTKLTPPKIAAAISAGGPLSMELRRDFRNWCGAHILDIYGSTETGVVGYRRRCPEGELSASTFLPEVSATGSDSDGYTLHSPLVPGGQLKLDDRLELLPDGRFKLLGRRDRIVKIEEKRVALDEVERRLMDTGLLEECSALTVKRGSRVLLSALLIPKDKSILGDKRAEALLGQKVRRLLIEHQDPSMVPRLFAVSPALPRNVMGKKDSAAIITLFAKT